MIKCPRCGKSHYEIIQINSTFAKYPQIYYGIKQCNGVVKSITMECKCLDCDYEFEARQTNL